MSLLETQGLTKRFGGLTAVDSVDLTLEPGELVGLIGPNGAGKTTFFNLLTGFYAPTSGRVLHKGRDVTGLPPRKVAALGIGRTFQNLRVMPNMTVFDTCSIGAAGRLGTPLLSALWPFPTARDAEISRRTYQALERVGLSQQASQLAANLPYGKRKILEIARAMAARPEILILDEPAAGLNDTETAELADFIRELSSEGLTILLVEHDMNLVMGICSRVVVLAFGRKIADASPDAVRADQAVLDAYLGGETCPSSK